MNDSNSGASEFPFTIVISDDLSLCWFGDQLVVYDLFSGDTHLLEGVAAWLVKVLLKGALTEDRLYQLYEERDDCLQFPLSRLIMSLEYTGIIRVRDADSRFATG